MQKLGWPFSHRWQVVIGFDDVIKDFFFPSFCRHGHFWNEFSSSFPLSQVLTRKKKFEIPWPNFPRGRICPTWLKDRRQVFDLLHLWEKDWGLEFSFFKILWSVFDGWALAWSNTTTLIKSIPLGRPTTINYISSCENIKAQKSWGHIDSSADVPRPWPIFQDRSVKVVLSRDLQLVWVCVCVKITFHSLIPFLSQTSFHLSLLEGNVKYTKGENWFTCRLFRRLPSLPWALGVEARLVSCCFSSVMFRLAMSCCPHMSGHKSVDLSRETWEICIYRPGQTSCSHTKPEYVSKNQFFAT